ncbi:gasdermin Eb [Clarias gariepinus]|uniref:gasdermin Eb n=1 Tax=Clarias gariepinus TaxID=13013 RepID=UPI00234D8F34|nr:gasdermin Eb [Clarias gariepinus]
MFAKATKKFVAEIDPDGSLIPVFRLNESDNLNVLSLVIKQTPSWFWQRPKYMTTDFTLNDVLLGDTPITPEVVEAYFLNYKQTRENNVTGGAQTEVGPGNVKIKGRGLFKLASSFGSLKKQEVDVQKLLNDCKDRCLDFQHCLLRQVIKRRRDVFALVKERIITTQTCTVTEEVQEGGSCSAFLGFNVPTQIQVSVNDGGIHCDRNVHLEIPAQTALAYSLMELNVMNTGQFELCLMPDTYGCVEVDGLLKTNSTLLNRTPPESSFQQLQEELDKLQDQFQVLSGLPANTRSGLFQQITLLMKDKTAITSLDHALNNSLCGIKSDLSTLDKLSCLKKAAETTLELLNQNERDHAPVERDQEPEPSVLTATHILVSALEEMSQSALTVLESCCQPLTIQALHLLIQNLMGNKDCSLKDSTLAVFAEEDTYSKVQVLFGFFSVILSKEEDSIQAQISTQKWHIPIILCIAIFSLASLVPPTG